MKNVLEFKGFIGTVNYSAEERVFFGKLEGINDLVTFEGTTVDALENSFKEMVNLHIEDCEREGKPSEKVYKGVFNVRVSNELHKKAAQKAAAEGITLNQLVKHAIKRELQNGKEPDCQ
jgi:predicted HicB family RNase H-like nuclease